jgi:hypothetical protein
MGRRWRWLRPLARRIVESFSEGPRLRQVLVAKFLLADHGFLRACQKHRLKCEDPIGAPAVMSPIAGGERWNVPAIVTVAALADWLGLTIGQLEWFADRRSLEYSCNRGRLRHYHYRPLAKRFGSVRLIESPKPRLKDIQRRILAGILDRIPAHDAAHGFRRGRSVKTFVSHHVGQQAILRVDLQDFFPSVRLSQVQAIFRSAGYPEAVADLLAGLCTNCAPVDVWNEIDMPSRQLSGTVRLYAQPHLPQGAPTSPALANLCAYRLDCRLLALARACGAAYTRYADDLAFSGELHFARIIKRFQVHVMATAMEEGFTVHPRKTCIMRQGVRQRLAGIVVNRQTNFPRRDYDRLKAILVNSIRLGPQSQNRGGHANFQAHLHGRVAFVEMLNPTRGKRLRELFMRIEW